jgi:hypothetical protein
LEDALLRLLSRVVELEGRAPESIADGSMEEALRELAEALRDREEGGQQVVRRPYVGVSTEVRLLSEMALALRLRMLQTGRQNVSGLSYFYHRLDEVISSLMDNGVGRAKAEKLQ